jgi:penicillin G amidase
MKFINLFLLLILKIGFIVLLSTKIGSVPPIGKFLCPFSGYAQNADRVKNSDKSISLKGLKDKVDIVFDENNIPHIYATCDEDLYYAQGYIVARDRLWQMDMQTRVAEGRLSEFIGEKVIDMDRQKRRIGLRKAAEESMKLMNDPATKLPLDNFAKGVNEYIESLNYASKPLEFKILDYNPEEWTPIRSALLLKLMAERLTAMEADIENTHFINAFGKETFDLLFPNYFPAQSPIIPKGTAFNFTSNQQISTTMPPNVKISQHPMGGTPERHYGSNNWAINGAKSASGNPILCNDPHLMLNLPCVWYEMHLVSPSQNVYGVTMPGAPGIVIGFNKNIAWGVTNGGRDVRNWYDIKFRDKHRDEYWHDSTWKPTTKRAEVIKIRGKADLVDTVIFTHHGPVVYDREFNSPKGEPNLSLGWTAHLPSNEMLTFMLLNKAKNHDDYMAATNHFICPSQNFVFACNNGDVAIRQAGLFPLTESNKDKFVLDGTLVENDMTNFIPIEQNPHILNPERGFVSSANQHPTDASYPYYYSSGEFEHYRGRRINEVLASKETHSVRDMMNLQGDNFCYVAYEVLPTLLKIMKADSNTNEYKILSKWDYQSMTNDPAPAIFECWWKTIQAKLWDELEGKEKIMKAPNQYTTSKLIVEHKNIDMWDIVSTKDKFESSEDIIRMSYDTMIREVRSFKALKKMALTWGNYRHTNMMHMAQIAAFSDMNIQANGYKHAVNAVDRLWGPSWRMVVELTPSGPVAYSIYPGGQSGNPGSAHWKDYVEKWINVQYKKITFNNKKEEIKKPNYTLTLTAKK